MNIPKNPPKTTQNRNPNEAMDDCKLTGFSIQSTFLDWPRAASKATSGLSKSTSESVTLPKTNIAPENRPSQKENSFPTIIFQGTC